jgi:3'(2'), 5'-bisphosphate nucleotidase
VPTLDATACAQMLDALTEIAARASEAILRVAAQGATVREKDDGSPVTAADEAAESIICEGLARLVPSVPIVSEEQASHDRPQTGARDSYFLVDPLDGTREFISGSEEYTVNIAVVTDGTPILGIVTAPAAGIAWRGIAGRGADRLPIGAGKIASQAIHARPRPQRELRVMVSRSHLDERTRAFVAKFPHATLMQCGSSVKFCRLAEGEADLYARLAPTHDWDIAAGHAILVAAGGEVTTPDGSPLTYGSKELLIPAFLAWADPRAKA